MDFLYVVNEVDDPGFFHVAGAWFFFYLVARPVWGLSFRIRLMVRIG